MPMSRSRSLAYNCFLNFRQRRWEGKKHLLGRRAHLKVETLGPRSAESGNRLWAGTVSVRGGVPPADNLNAHSWAGNGLWQP